MKENCWEHYSHPADMGIRGRGRTVEEAFEQTAMALTAVIADLDTIEALEAVEINCRDDNIEMLLVNFLSKLLYEMSTRRMLFSRFEVKIDNGFLNAKAWGQKINIEKHKPAVEVKAVTYADLKVCQDSNGRWLAQCIVDV